MLSFKEINLLDKRTLGLFKKFVEEPNNSVLQRRLVYEINNMQNAITFKLNDNKVSDEEYDILLDISFKWNSLIKLRRLPQDILYFPKNQDFLKRNLRRLIFGTVVSNKMDKTAVILVLRRVKNLKYKKYVIKSKKYKVHDEGNSLQIGDFISAMECRPLSKDKRFRLNQIIEKAK